LIHMWKPVLVDPLASIGPLEEDWQRSWREPWR
jgi:hypothetical protein